MAQQRFQHLARRLKEFRHSFQELCRNDVPGVLAARTYCQHLFESLDKALAEGCRDSNGWALVAVGGFGRGELSFASDLDLLFLHQNKLPPALQDIVREFTYSLWDAGFEVGHATASVSGVKRLVQEDFTVLTNYLEARFIGGERSFFEKWQTSFLKSFGSQSRRRFLKHVVQYRTGRVHQYGDSSYLLEPHVKEGVGGLRDLHVLRWAGKVYLQDVSLDAMVMKNWMTPQEKLWVEQAYDFLWRVRLQLHQLSGRRQDQLLFPEQESLAHRLGCMDGQQGSAVEAFMRLYYRHTARIRRTGSFFLERVEESQRRFPKLRLRRRILPGPFLLEGRHLHFLEPEWIVKDPRILMRFFWQAARSNATFHHQAGQVIRENLAAFSDAVRRDPEVVKQFFDILLDSRHAFRVLDVMLETGFLDVFIPEFSVLRYRVQHDVYHLYTVDEHLLRTVLELHGMEENGEEDLVPLELKDIFVQVGNRRVLYFAALVHDIGKGGGKGHAERGAAMAHEISERIGFTSEEAELLRFLIEHHLLLPETALKRDLMDEKPVAHCAMVIGDRERLRLLYLLSIADSRATGSGAWSTWKASLLRELYEKVDRLLLRGDWHGEDLQKRSEEVERAVLKRVGETPERSKVEKWIETLPFRYLLSQPPDEIVRHYEMEKTLAHNPVATSAKRADGEMWQFTIATRDRPGLFAMITGVLWIRGLNILAADIFTTESGIALDILTVERVPDPLHPEDHWQKIHTDLKRSLTEKNYLEELVAQKNRPSLLQQKSLPRKMDRVVIDEEASDFYTVVEVYTWDRPGVLHAITRTLYRHGISIQLAKISTPGAQVADVFYVTDLSNNKLMNADLHANLKKSLLECLSFDC